jgi:hypothetical protein
VEKTVQEAEGTKKQSKEKEYEVQTREDEATTHDIFFSACSCRVRVRKE